MRNIYFSVILAMIAIQASAQIGAGINIANPQGVLHIDGKGDTNGSLNGTDDVIITTTGNLGIGTLTPGEKLEIVGNAKFNADNYVNGNISVGNRLSAMKTLRLGVDNLDNASSAPNLQLLSKTGVPKVKKNIFRLNGGVDLTVPQFIPVLGMNASTGEGGWMNLPYASEYVVGTIRNGITVSKNNSNPVEISINSDNSTGIDLTPGTWLIIARAGISTGFGLASNSGCFYMWMHLGDAANPSKYNVIGVYPEQTGYAVSTPQMVTLLNVTSKIDLHVYISTSAGTSTGGKNPANGNIINTAGPGYTFKTNSAFADLAFFAMKLDNN